MKGIRTIFISILLFASIIYCLSTLGTKIYINNYSDLTAEDKNKLSQLSVEVGYINTNINNFNNTKEFQETNVANIKEYIAEFLDSKSTIQQFVDFLKQAYRGGDILLMAFPIAVYDSLGWFINVYRVLFIAIITIAIYNAVRTGETSTG